MITLKTAYMYDTVVSVFDVNNGRRNVLNGVGTITFAVLNMYMHCFMVSQCNK